MKREQLLLNLIDCQEGLDDHNDLLKILRELPNLIDMKALTLPQLVAGTVKPGYTGFVVIEESHIAIHTFTDLSLVWVDICSCKAFDKEIVREYLKMSFKPKIIEEKGGEKIWQM